MSSKPLEPAPLAPHYYRENFLSLLETVRSQYGDLLNEAEQDFVCRYLGASFDAQCLYIRLISRVGPWFRLERLDYPELGAIPDAVDELVAEGLAVDATTLTAAELGSLYTRAELIAAFGLAAKTGKAQLLAELEGRTLGAFAPIDDGRVIAPLESNTVALLQLLFFGNRYQGLTDFVLSDLGVARYYPYLLDRSHRLFPERAALEEYLRCADIADRWREARELDEPQDCLLQLADEALRFAPVHDTTLKRWYRLLNTLARELERCDQPQLALELYRLSALQPARERAARLLERDEQWREALRLCEEILDAPWGEEERDAALRILPRLKRKLEGGKQARRRDTFREIHISLERGDASVEVLVADYLGPDWHSVAYVENALMNGLFGLAFWEQIFAPLPGAFNNPFQSVPADMYEQGFYRRRQSLVQQRVEELQTLCLATELPRLFRHYFGMQCRWLNWRYLDEALVQRAATLIPQQHLLAIWGRILFDPGENRRGFPDLIALGEAEGEYAMIEVKGPGDALQESQKRWLRFFAEQGIPAEVAWVSWRNA